jgi:diguanylate cyclase (GGDEF)-like protein
MLEKRATHKQWSTDALTGLAGGLKLNVVLGRYVGAVETVSLVLFDVDVFTFYNMTFGTEAGDKVLRNLSQLLVEAVKPHQGEAFRLRADDFATVLPGLDYQQATDFGKSVQQKFVELKIPFRHAQVVWDQPHLTLSMGVSNYLRGQEQDVNSTRIYDMAEGALVFSKANMRTKLGRMASADRDKKKHDHHDGHPPGCHCD